MNGQRSSRTSKFSQSLCTLSFIPSVSRTEHRRERTNTHLPRFLGPEPTRSEDFSRDKMNTTSLLLNNTTLPSPSSTKSTRPVLRHSRTSSRDSTGWYLDHDTPTLEDFAMRAQTLAKRMERYQNQCATNIVMALMRPTPVVLLLLNPLAIVLWVVVAVAWAFR